MKAPTLQTPRLSLRAHRLQDFEDYARIWADPGVCRHIGGKVRTREESWIRFLRHFGMWQVVGYGFWAIEEKATGLFLGEAGFLRRDATPTDPEAGWALLPEAQGRGFATEALAAILTWGDRHLGGRKQVCVIEPGNVSSLRVAAKCGFVPAGSATKDGRTISVFERSTAP